MKKNFFIISGLLLVILFLMLFSNMQSKNWLNNFSQIDTSDLKLSNTESYLEPYDENNYETFNTLDGNLKLNYPAGWLVMQGSNFFSTITPQEWITKYNLKTILLVQQLKTDELAQLVVQEGEFNVSNEEIIEEMKKVNQEQGLTMEIIEVNNQNGKLIFETRYLTGAGSNIYAKEAILPSQGKTYLVAFISLEKDWPEVQERANFIIDSAETRD